ncbi:transmembrane protein, putative [Medicago truncatula]|uniref:Transmembrane protein, putative n=1 Tax=Medicago truncatula TaxID=3880 RepID=G7ITN6_MEDTR|nr:transmembrane protein, putative [Medicago truncatula]
MTFPAYSGILLIMSIPTMFSFLLSHEINVDSLFFWMYLYVALNMNGVKSYEVEGVFITFNENLREVNKKWRPEIESTNQGRKPEKKLMGDNPFPREFSSVGMDNA